MDLPRPESEPAFDSESPTKLADLALATLIAVTASPLVAVAMVAVVVPLGLAWLSSLFALAGLSAVIAILIVAYRAIREGHRALLHAIAAGVVFVALPAWGIFYSHAFGSGCTISSCESGSSEFRPLAEPALWGLVGLHVAVALAYAISRRRSAALPGFVEPLLHAMLIVGLVEHVLLAIHFGPWVLAGFAFPPLFLPCSMPILGALFLLIELRRRLHLRAADAGALVPSIDRPTLVHALTLSPVLLGLYAVGHMLWLGGVTAALDVFTNTCGYTLSRVPIVIVPQDCHYLCTVAARGHRWLVRPERIGVRRGVPIIVNRQLAVANAFEDLLHERWPRFGRLARSIYDRLGLPVSRVIRAAWLSDVVYLAMKPFEWGFYLVLLLLDRADPERRIARMYLP